MTTRSVDNHAHDNCLAGGDELVVQISLGREILWISASFSDAIGRTSQEFVGHQFDEFVADLDSLERAWDVSRLAANETLIAPLTLRRHAASTVRCRATFHPIASASGLVDAVVVVLRGADDPTDSAPDLDLYQLLAENISDVVSMTEGQGSISWVSPSIESLLGRPAADLIGHNFNEYTFHDDLPVVAAALKKILRGETVQFEVRLLHADGSLRWTSIASHVVDLPGRDRARIAVWRDVTEAMKARERLIESQREFQRVAENASDAVIQTDIEGKVEWVSPSLSTVLGWRPVDVLGKNLLELIATTDAARAEAWQSLVLTGERVRSAQMRYRTATNESRWMSVRAQPLVENRRPQGIIMSLRDCHDEVIGRRALSTLSAASRALTRSENEDELLTTMCQAAVNEGGYLLCWYARPDDGDPAYFSCVASSFEHRVYAESSHFTWSDDQEGRNPAGVAWRSGQTIVVNDRLNDNRFSEVDPDAQVRGFRATIVLPVRCAREPDGVLVVEAPETGAFDVSVTNVLEELAAQIGFGLQRLRDRDRLLHSLSEQLLLSAAVRQSGESIAITDTKANLIYANPAVLHSSGYELHELLGKNPRIFQSGLQNRAFYEAMWQQLSNGATWRGVLVNKRKNGDLYEEEATISPIHDETGRLTGYVAVKRDLTLERNLKADLTSDGNDRNTILDIMREMRPVSSLPAMANLFCRLVTRLDGIDAATLMILHLNDVLEVLGTQGNSVFAAAPAPSLPASVVAEQVHQGFPAAVIDLRDEKWLEYPILHDAITSSGIEGVVVSPLRWNDSTIGVLVLATADPSIASTFTRRLPAFDQLGSYAGSFFGTQIETQRHRESLRSEIHAIIEQKGFTPVFQPFVELATGNIVGYEALTRFTDGRSPEVVFREATQAGLGPELEAACASAAVEAARDLDADKWISLNFSAAALLGHYVEPVVSHANRSIVIEVTEHASIENYAAVTNIIASLPNCKLAVDDGGSDKSAAGFAYILELKPDYVKLDITLIKGIDTRPDLQAMTAGLCFYAAQTNTILIAEGIETEAEAATLMRLGVSLQKDSHLLGQGYFFGRPMPLG